MAGDEGAGDAAVEVEVADAELAFGAFEVGGFAAEDAAGEFVGEAVGDPEGFGEVAGVHEGEDGAEDFLAGEFVGFGDGPEEVRGDEAALLAPGWSNGGLGSPRLLWLDPGGLGSPPHCR